MLTWSTAAWLLVSAVQPGVDGSGARPACTAATRGMFWPPEAVRTEHGKQCEDLAMCTGALFGHRWKVVRTPYWKLAGREAPGSCRHERGEQD